MIHFQSPREVVVNGIKEGAFPGAAWGYGTVSHCEVEVAGRFGYQERSNLVEVSTLWDLASLTKVVATTALAMKLFEMGLFALDDKVGRYLPAFGCHGKDAVTIRHLMLHSSGLYPFRDYHTNLMTPEGIISSIYDEHLMSVPGENFAYSDLGFIVLGRVLEVIAGLSLDRAVIQFVTDPLGLGSTRFKLSNELCRFAAPTETLPAWRKNNLSLGTNSLEVLNEGKFIQGKVHDETCYLLGGVSGHAGLFSTITDLVRIAKVLVGGNEVFGCGTTIATNLMFGRRSSVSSTRGLGWDTKALSGFSSAGHLFGNHSYGHLGFTGTSLWIDPESGCFCVLLTNRVHPTREREGIGVIRRLFADACYQAIFK